MGTAVSAIRTETNCAQYRATAAAIAAGEIWNVVVCNIYLVLNIRRCVWANVHDVYVRALSLVALHQGRGHVVVHLQIFLEVDYHLSHWLVYCVVVQSQLTPQSTRALHMSVLG